MNTSKKLDIVKLRAHLQTAIDVELSTIPIYLYTYYSINRMPSVPSTKRGNQIATFANKAGGVIMSVAVEEMLHLSLVSNILKSLGGKPKIYGQSPDHYPTDLLHHKKGFLIGLTKFTKNQLEKFMDVEKPAPLAPAPEPNNWETLGQFYEYISSLIELTSPSDYTKKDKAHTNQLVAGKGYYASSNVDTVYPKDAFYLQQPENPNDPSARGADQAQFPNNDESGGLRHIRGKKEALAAIHEISEQGEGQRKDPAHKYDDKDKTEDSHWFKYNELHKDFSSMKLTSKEIAGFVHNFPDSPHICSMPRGMQFMVDLNNAAYSYLLWMTELSFTLYGSAQSSMFYIGMHKGMIFILDKLIGGMRYLTYKDEKGNEYNLAPTFDNYEFSSIETAKQELVALCELVASKPDLKLDPNILERIKDLPDVNVVNNVVSFAYKNKYIMDQPIIDNPKELHACMGLNACKGHDRLGTNSCAGTGSCATASEHSCHTLNNCRSQGGCGLYGTPDEQNNPGNNACSWQGSCAVPINAERFSTEGKNKGLSVWSRARVIFEEKMDKANRQYGASPMSNGPTLAYLTTNYNKSYNACGASGLSGGGSCI